MNSFVVVIPARLASERLPRKPLLDIGGQTMIERVYRQASASDASEVLIATDSTEIETACRRFGAAVEMTSVDHASGTDRIAEVAWRRQWPDDQIVINVQGDEPLLPPLLIDQLAAMLDACIGVGFEHRDADDASCGRQRIPRSEYGQGNQRRVGKGPVFQSRADSRNSRRSAAGHRKASCRHVRLPGRLSEAPCRDPGCTCGARRKTRAASSALDRRAYTRR